MRKILLCLTLVGSILLTPTLPASAIPIQKIQNPQSISETRWVTDQAKSLSKSTETILNDKISKLEKSQATEIAVVTVQDIQPEATIEDYANKLFNRWGIGKAKSDNGLLILWSTGDRKIRIEVGYGLESTIPDAMANAIIQDKAIPNLKLETQQGNDEAIIQSIDALIETLRGTPYEYEAELDGWALFWIILIILLFLVVCIAAEGGGSYSSGYGGSSGSSFGGGSSGGGGASGGY